MPRSRNKDGSAPNQGNPGGGNAKKIPGGSGTPVAGATPAVGGAQQAANVAGAGGTN